MKLLIKQGKSHTGHFFSPIHISVPGLLFQDSKFLLFLLIVLIEGSIGINSKLFDAKGKLLLLKEKLSFIFIAIQGNFVLNDSFIGSGVRAFTALCTTSQIGHQGCLSPICPICLQPS